MGLFALSFQSFYIFIKDFISCPSWQSLSVLLFVTDGGGLDSNYRKLDHLRTVTQSWIIWEQWHKAGSFENSDTKLDHLRTVTESWIIWEQWQKAGSFENSDTKLDHLRTVTESWIIWEQWHKAGSFENSDTKLDHLRTVTQQVCQGPTMSQHGEACCHWHAVTDSDNNVAAFNKHLKVFFWHENVFLEEDKDPLFH